MCRNSPRKENDQKNPITKETKNERNIKDQNTETTGGTPNWSRQHICAARTVECQNFKKKGHYEKMCRLPRKIQHVDKASSSAEEDNWDYNKIQSINNKKKGNYFHVTLLVNNASIKFIVDSGSPVTLIPQRLFNEITKVEKLETNYKDVNNNTIEFVGSTEAMVRTNNTTLQLPILITKANIRPVMGLDWMKRLEISLNTTNENIKIHNIRMDDTEKKILKLKNEFKDLFYNNTEIKNLSVKINLKEDANIIQQKGHPIPIHLQNKVAEEIKRLIKNGYLERATEITDDCFVSPAVITVKKDKSIKIALNSRKLNKATIKRKAQMPNMEELISRITKRNLRKTRRRNLDNKIRLRLCLRTNQIRRSNKKSVYILRHRKRIYRILPFPKRFLRTGGYSNNISRNGKTKHWSSNTLLG